MHIVRTILCLVLFLTATSGVASSPSRVSTGVASSSSETAVSLMEKGDSCRHDFLYNKALSFYQRAYVMPSVKKDETLQLQLLERIMRTHDVLRHWKELSETSYQLYTLAKRQNAPVHIALALFMQGKRMYLEGRKADGYRTCLEAVQQLKQTDYSQKNHELAALYAILVKMYGKDGNYEGAMRLSKEQERYVTLALQEEGAAHRNHGVYRLYAIRSWLLAKMGRLAEADSLYRQHVVMPCTDPICDDALPEYYDMQRMDSDALRYIDIAMQNIREDGDTIGRNMQRLLDDEGDIHYRMGEFQKAAECYRGVTVLADTLSVRSLRNISNEVQRAIAGERAVSRHNLILALAVAGILLLLVVVVLLLRHDRIVNRKNRAMTMTVRELMHYRDIVIANGNSVEMAENESEQKEPDDDSKRFKQMDKRVMKEELFRDPNFGRDELMRLMGVDKNAISSIISRNTGMNVTGYVNTKRMEYAVSLMRLHPEYTMGAISEACGIKSQATFIRNFRNAYGMTPSEFRKSVEELPPLTDKTITISDKIENFLI